MSFYRNVIVETYYGRNTTSSKGVRARPIDGQGLPASMNVECSSSMRKSHPVGTKFLISAKVTNKEGGPDFLYSHYNSPYQVVTNEESQKFIKSKNS